MLGERAAQLTAPAPAAERQRAFVHTFLVHVTSAKGLHGGEAAAVAGGGRYIAYTFPGEQNEVTSWAVSALISPADTAAVVSAPMRRSQLNQDRPTVGAQGHRGPGVPMRG